MLCLLMTRALLQLRAVGDAPCYAVIEDGAWRSRCEHVRRNVRDDRGTASNCPPPVRRVRGWSAPGPWTRSVGAELRSPDGPRMRCVSCQLAGTHSRGQAIQA